MDIRHTSRDDLRAEVARLQRPYVHGATEIQVVAHSTDEVRLSLGGDARVYLPRDIRAGAGSDEAVVAALDSARQRAERILDIYRELRRRDDVPPSVALWEYASDAARGQMIDVQYAEIGRYIYRREVDRSVGPGPRYWRALREQVTGWTAYGPRGEIRWERTDAVPSMAVSA